MILRFVFGYLLALLVTLRSGAAEGMTGCILDPVSCAKDAGQTYALYVPSRYTAEKKWPVIFCFDPGARGRVPVERLQAAAEKYGYIVAGSLTSRNGPWAANAAAIQAMVRDVESHLSIDVRRIYAAGLSGGARVATQVAIGGLAKGVIACSAGFPASEEGIPAKVPFFFFGTAGTDDFNHGELRRLDDELESRRATHRVVIFTGGHEWASAGLLTEAVEWFELQAMRGGTRARDEEFIGAQWETRLASVPATLGLARWRGLKSLAVDFKGLRDVTAIERQSKELGAGRETKEALKAERALERKETELVTKLADLASGGATKPMKSLVGELRARSQVADDTEDRRLARRVLAGFGSSGREATRAMFESGDYLEAAELLQVLVEVRPGQSRTLYDLARARAGAGDKKLAIEDLRRAVDAGFSDASRVESEKLFAKIRAEPGFHAALDKIRANPPEPVGRGRER